jgi:hypothetical protein
MYSVKGKIGGSMSVFVSFAADLVSFPGAVFAGSEYKEIKETARDFIYSAARVVFACSIVWGLFKAQQWEPLRKFTLPVVLLTGHAGRLIVSLEPISLLINLCLVATAQSKWKTGGYCAVVAIWQCMVQTLSHWTKEPPTVFFSATVQRAQLNINPLTHLMNIAVWKVPETRLGISLFLTIHGIYQLHAYTMDRWNLFDAPTRYALKGVFHVACGLCWLGAYDNDHRKLEKKNTYLYKAADLIAPKVAWLVTGQSA